MYWVILLILGAGCVVAFVLGVWLYINPAAGALLNRPVGETLRGLRTSIRVERYIYRNHRPFGALVLLGALFILIKLRTLVGMDLTRVASHHSKVEAWLWESLVMFSFLGSLFAMAVGGVIMTRPSLLKNFEAWSNRHVTRESLREGMVRFRQAVLHRLSENPRLFAALLMGGSALVLWQIFRYWHQLRMGL